MFDHVGGEGISDSLIRSLGSGTGLRVVARWSSFPYRGTELTDAGVRALSAEVARLSAEAPGSSSVGRSSIPVIVLVVMAMFMPRSASILS